MSALQREHLKSKLPPMPNPGGGMGGRRGGRQRDYTPLHWDKYFEKAEFIQLDNGSTFRVYRTGSSGPLLYLLHGGGFCGLTWACFVTEIMTMVECQVLAVDVRGHGETYTEDDSDLSIEVLVQDIVDVFNKIFEEDQPEVVLIGHSMGGAIAIHAAYQNLLSTLISLVVIDVVEGSAIDALQSMQSFLRSRPSQFQTIEKAIEWCVRSGQIRNVESARISMPGQLKSKQTDMPATFEESKPTVNAVSDSILEEGEEEKTVQNEVPIPETENFKIPGTTSYIWRIDLSKTEKFWLGWFSGLSNMFLSSSIPKLLLLAGIDRLDKDLTIGQMQGKFQMQVLPQCGHSVHEDCPDKVAEAISTFLVRNKFTQPLSNFQRTFPAC